MTERGFAYGSSRFRNYARHWSTTWREILRYACRSFPARSPRSVHDRDHGGARPLVQVTVVFTILNAFVFQADEVRNPRCELFAVQHQRPTNTAPQGFTRRSSTKRSSAEHGVPSRKRSRQVRKVDAYVDGPRKEGVLVTGNFFEVLGVGAERGRALTPEDDAPGAPAALVLSHRAWSQYFASDPECRRPHAPGQRHSVRRRRCHAGALSRVAAVAAPDFWAPVSRSASSAAAIKRATDPLSLDIVGRLTPGLTPDQALAQLLHVGIRCA